jgi:flagellar protein FlbD
MLQLTRLGGPVFALNPDLIERAEATPDTVVTLVNGSKYVVRESLDELIDLVCEFRARVVRLSQQSGHEPRKQPRPVASVSPLRSGEH